MEKDFDVRIITQNVDNLHERAGSTKVLHLHGILTQAKSSIDNSLIYDIGYNDINVGDKCEKGSQLRPNIVWFGEMVPAISEAAAVSSKSDIFLVIGSSLNVYPAAGLLNYVSYETPVYLIDPNPVNPTFQKRITFINEKAGKGMQILKETLLTLK